MLHITNGSSVALKQTNLPGDVIYWADVLHEGPVPAGLSLRELSRIRERFLTDFYPDPAALESFVRAGDSSLAYLITGLRRHLEQFPGISNGLSRTERQMLQVIAGGAHRFQEMFPAEQKMEESIFMGDTTFLCHLDRLQHSRIPLVVEDADQRYELTEFGRAVLAGAEDHVAVNGIDRWLGGVYLRDGAPVWRWDSQNARLRPSKQARSL